MDQKLLKSHGHFLGVAWHFPKAFSQEFTKFSGDVLSHKGQVL